MYIGTYFCIQMFVRILSDTKLRPFLPTLRQLNLYNNINKPLVWIKLKSVCVYVCMYVCNVITCEQLIGSKNGSRH